MAIRYIFNTPGKYVAFLQNGYLFTAEGTYIGFVKSNSQVFSKHGEFVGYLLDDDRVVKRPGEPPKMPVIPPLEPLGPLAPLPPFNRFAFPPLPPGYEDVFDSTHNQDFRGSTRSNFAQFAEMNIVATDGTFLGKISKNMYDKDSISNRYGLGSSYNANSIFNQYGKYGGKYSDQSPFNAYASRPPFIENGRMKVAVLSVNRFSSGTLPRVDPKELLLWLGHIVSA